MKKTPTKNDLFDYLDIYTFVWDFEVIGAIENFFREINLRESKAKNEDRSPSYWELLYFQELAEEYIKDRNLTFEEDKPQLQRDTEWIIEAYENKVEQYADYYSESY